MFKKILLAIDLADIDIARPAIARATEMAKLADADLRLLYVRPIMPVMMLEYVPDGFDAERKAEEEAKLREIAAGVGLPTGRISLAVRQGGVYPETIAEAEEWGADLIVAGSHRPAMSTYLLGSNAAAIVRHAACSVLVIR